MLDLIVLFFSMIVQVVIPPIPAELIVIGASSAYGIAATTFIAGSGLWIGSVVVYFFGAFIEKKFPQLFNRKKVKILSEKIRTYDTFILWIRILPYNPSDIISYTAGLLKFDYRKFIVITGFTSYIRCYLLAMLGSFSFSLTTVAVIIIILILSGVGAHYLLFLMKRRN